MFLIHFAVGYILGKVWGEHRGIEKFVHLYSEAFTRRMTEELARR